jgi:hypothetical protein
MSIIEPKEGLKIRPLASHRIHGSLGEIISDLVRTADGGVLIFTSQEGKICYFRTARLTSLMGFADHMLNTLNFEVVDD